MRVARLRPVPKTMRTRSHQVQRLALVDLPPPDSAVAKPKLRARQGGLASPLVKDSSHPPDRGQSPPTLGFMSLSARCGASAGKCVLPHAAVAVAQTHSVVATWEGNKPQQGKSQQRCMRTFSCICRPTSAAASQQHSLAAAAAAAAAANKAVNSDLMKDDPPCRAGMPAVCVFLDCTERGPARRTPCGYVCRSSQRSGTKAQLGAVMVQAQVPAAVPRATTHE